ncbi:MAG: AAA family ATPase [Bacteroidetes bacterium GWF2_42_66]|nr:MAG: AAA family ATPase [Bacteroidetes bacterium GWA2_42_15]OFY01131.1 MAG: AAA family ATPase [Bacteroidetes bacterium GWE2_42_39]OFY41974.1 MAG: AAA family ATPase [Bacteroidetes bacterium GWF2_42_66]HBL77828.1 AAA family ATPase [Prolixibacteraceae bacterium]HCR90530.1 AAA family ATPase [Prolixibacteraceae bacterium]
MEHLIDIHNTLQSSTRNTIKRELSNEINWNDRMICIKGFRGVGKTTFLLDIVRDQYLNDRTCLYVNLNSFYFSRRKIFNFADEFYKKGGKTLILDQINKYPDWAKELRSCYDEFPDLKIIFSASPVIRVIDGNEYLNGIAKVYHLEGLSFREYINFTTGLAFRRYTLNEIIDNHLSIAGSITEKIKPLAFFNEYLKEGYYPYFLHNKPFYNETLLKHINLALEIDVTYLNQIELKYLPRLRKLLQIISSHVPFSPNVSKLSADVKTSRATIMNYLAYLKNARLINQLFSNGNDDQMKKPDQVYLQNTNLIYAIDPGNVNNNNLRLTFFYNQVGYQYEIKNSAIADFKVNGEYHFSVGGKYTEPKGENCYAAADLIEIGDGNIIPLWLFGFLY